VNVGFPTSIFTNIKLGTGPLKPIFEDYHRDVLLSFRGSIARLDTGGYRTLEHLVTFRKHNVRELYAKRKTVNAASSLKKIFWAPGVIGLEDLDDPAEDLKNDTHASAVKFSRAQQHLHPLENTVVTVMTYLRSHFCFQPPGERGAE
jgi:hypothetical protein